MNINRSNLELSSLFEITKNIGSRWRNVKSSFAGLVCGNLDDNSVRSNHYVIPIHTISNTTIATANTTTIRIGQYFPTETLCVGSLKSWANLLSHTFNVEQVRYHMIVR